MHHCDVLQNDKISEGIIVLKYQVFLNFYVFIDAQ